MENNICIHQSFGFATHATTLEEKNLISKVEKLVLNPDFLSSEHQTVSSELKTLSSKHQTVSSELKTLSSEVKTLSSEVKTLSK